MDNNKICFIILVAYIDNMQMQQCNESAWNEPNFLTYSLLVQHRADR